MQSSDVSIIAVTSVTNALELHTKAPCEEWLQKAEFSNSLVKWCKKEKLPKNGLLSAMDKLRWIIQLHHEITIIKVYRILIIYTDG